MAVKQTNPGMLKAIFDGWYNGGPSTHKGWTFQKLILEAPKLALTAPLITGWRNAAGKEYSTSIAQQLAYNAQGIARIEARQAAQEEILRQLAAGGGSPLTIDYARIDASIKAHMPEFPEYELTKKEQ